MVRRFTQKKKKGGYRGSLGGAPMRGAFTTGAQQELKQMGGVSRATEKSIKKALKTQKNAANAAKKAANNAAANAKKAANNAQRARNSVNAIQRAQNEQKAQNRIMINDLVQKLGHKHRSIAPYVPLLTNEQKAQNVHYRKMVNDLVGKD